MRKVHVMPEEAVSTLKENAAWIAKRVPVLAGSLMAWKSYRVRT